jgi:hypothetical protein
MRVRPAVCVFAWLGAAIACGSPTTLTAVWKAPGVTGVRFQKVLVAAQDKDQTRRRNMEAFLVKRLQNATASYELLSEEEARDTARAKAKIIAGRFDGAVVVRFVGSRDRQTYTPGTSYWGVAPYGTMWGFWGYGWGAVYEPGYMTNDTVVTLESNVYSVSRDELIWSSRSDTVSPDSVNKLMQSMVDATAKEMRRQKVI